MKRLLLWRHAKASAGDPGQDDADRPLAERGKRAARALAKARLPCLAEATLVLCSPARRTRETWEALASQLAHPPALRFEPGLYLAGPFELLERAARVDERHVCGLLIGHNPGLAELLGLLVAGGDAQAISRASGGFKPGALAELRLQIGHWREVGAGCGWLEAFTRPRDLASAERSP